MNSEELPNYKKNALAQVYLTPLAVQQQLNTDFERALWHFPENFSTEPLNLEEIKNHTQEILLAILKKGEQELLKILYFVDIPEKDFYSILGTPDFIDLLSEKIIIREAYKIFLRHKFGNHSAKM